MSDKPARENIRQHQALLAYSSMPDPSLQKLHQTWEKHVPKIKRPALRTLKEWCRKYQWVARTEAIHEAAKEEEIKNAVEQLEILTAKYKQSLLLRNKEKLNRQHVV